MRAYCPRLYLYSTKNLVEADSSVDQMTLGERSFDRSQDIWRKSERWPCVGYSEECVRTVVSVRGVLASCIVGLNVPHIEALGCSLVRGAKWIESFVVVVLSFGLCCMFGYELTCLVLGLHWEFAVHLDIKRFRVTSRIVGPGFIYIQERLVINHSCLFCDLE